MNTIELTGDDRITNRDIAHTAYNNLPGVIYFETLHEGDISLERADGGTLVFNLEETREWTETDDEDVETITVDGWTATIYDAEGTAETTDGAPIHTPADLHFLTDYIAAWAA